MSIQFVCSNSGTSCIVNENQNLPVFLSFLRMEIYDSPHDTKLNVRDFPFRVISRVFHSPLVFIILLFFRLFSDYWNKTIFGATTRNSVRKEFSHITKHERNVVRERQHSVDVGLR